MNILCFGLSHHTAPVDLRERFAISDHASGEIASELGKLPGVSEAVVVSTCNRVEFYLAAEDAQLGFGALKEFLAARKMAVSDVPSAFYEHETAQSLAHLFRVVSGLDSMVIGETEILGQVKKAYHRAHASGGTARYLNKFFQRSFNVAKEVRSKTNITRGPVSVGSAAVELAEKIFGKLANCHVMILGAGETAEMTARALHLRGVKSIFVSNRSHERAENLAREMNGRAIYFEEWPERVCDIDILISSTAAPHAIVTREQMASVMQQRKNRPLFAIDLAVPRDIEADVNDLSGVYLYDIDSLTTIAQQSLALRHLEVAHCERLIARHVTEFSAWLGGDFAKELDSHTLPLTAEQQAPSL